MQAITHLIAGVPVSDLDTDTDWYTRFFEQPPDLRVGEEILWDVDEHATLFIEPDAAQAGAGRITFAGVALDSLPGAPSCPGHRARTDRDRFRRGPLREDPRSGWERDGRRLPDAANASPGWAGRAAMIGVCSACLGDARS